MLLAQLKLELDHLDMRIDEANALIKKTACGNEACQRLVAIPGIGPLRPLLSQLQRALPGNAARFACSMGYALHA